jgi:hypothetical protein
LIRRISLIDIGRRRRRMGGFDLYWGIYLEFFYGVFYNYDGGYIGGMVI